MQIWRRVDVVLQNHTQELLTIEGCINIQGQWNAAGIPKVGAIVTKQGAAKWSSISSEPEGTAEASIHIGSTKGYIDVYWALPEDVSAFTLSVRVPPGLAESHSIGGPDDDFRVVLITLVAGEGKTLPFRVG